MSRNVFKKSSLAILALTLAIPPSAAVMARTARQSDVLEFVKEAHRVTRESIQTLECRVDFDGMVKSTGKKMTCSGKFWYSRDAVRAQISEFGQVQDYLWKNSVREMVVRESAQSRVSASRSAFANRHMSRCDAWGRAQLLLNVPGTIDDIPFEDLLLKATKVGTSERSSIDGRELVVVRLVFGASEARKLKWEVEIRFDPGANYLVQKTIYTASDGLRRENEVTAFQEYAPGVYFPEKLVGRTGSKGNWDYENSTTISAVRINQALPEQIFDFRYPKGIYLTDTIRDVGYRVDERGNSISAATPLGKFPPPPLGEGGTETVDEPRPGSWLLPVSLSVLGLGALLAIVRLYRRRTAANVTE